MKIPKEAVARYALYRELITECMVSQNERASTGERLRCYYLWGCDSGAQPALYNKILPQIDLLHSFVFASDTTRFGIDIGESAYAKGDLGKVASMTAHLNNRWHASNCDIVFGQALTWSFVQGSTFVKLAQRDRVTVPYVVDSQCMGVLDEGMIALDDQEAFVHEYTVSLKVLDRMFEDHPRRKEIIGSVSRSLGQEKGDVPSGVGRIVMSMFPMASGGPQGPGVLSTNLDMAFGYRARTQDERVAFQELWVWDDDANDYRIATLAGGDVVVYDRTNFFLSGEHPFVQVRPNPNFGYLWGESEVDRLTALQDYREMRMRQIADLLQRQVKPPTSMRGNFQGIDDETALAMNMFGGGVVSQDATADFKVWQPTLPADNFAEIRAIDEMFNEMTGLSNVQQGKGEAGVRSKGQTTELARLGSSRAKKRAMLIEDSLDKIATLYVKLMRQHDDTHMLDEEGQEFIAEQFTSDFTAKVDAHSSSPIFVEDQKKLAFDLHEAGAIDNDSLLQQTAPPHQQLLRAKLKRMEAAKAKAHKEEQELAAKTGKAPLKAAK